MKNNIIQNPVIFGYKKIENLKEYRFIYLGKLYEQKLKLQKILNKIEKNKSKLGDIYYSLLKKEINFVYKKIDFLKNVYDFEANKIDSKYEISYPEFDYDFYNKKFFGVTKFSILNDVEITPLEENNQFISKNDLLDLLKFSKNNIPELKYKFGAYAFMSHSSGTLVIPNKKNYSLRELITLFFHEMTHFLRRYNNKRNFGTSYGFSDYMKYEEGFALYNEYYYGEKLIPGLKYNPYYDACYSVLLNEKLSQKQKQDKIYNILKIKGFTREKAIHYYYRFHRYASLGGNNFFLKDLVYTSGYNKVLKLLSKKQKNYDIIFSGRIGPSIYKAKLYNIENNFDSKTYFEQIYLEIEKKIGD
ncbi:DUF1704 domain-containing protein [Candidatus Gracilibacteria bacterium]|nr:DUF1704 domain-containing protein [Candidatus Gracilibacteria bacterium]